MRSVPPYSFGGTLSYNGATCAIRIASRRTRETTGPDHRREVAGDRALDRRHADAERDPPEERVAILDAEPQEADADDLAVTRVLVL